jgi:hypothetical protein
MYFLEYPLETRKFHFGAKIQILILSGKITHLSMEISDFCNSFYAQFCVQAINHPHPAGGVASLKIRNAFCDG